MVYNPARVTISDWDNELLSDTKLNQMLNNIDHNYKYKPNTGPDTPSAGCKIACGQAALVFSNEASKQETVVFATDSDYGDPDFDNTPRIVITMVSAGAWLAACNTLSSTQFNILVTISYHTDLYTGTIYVDWIAFGD